MIRLLVCGVLLFAAPRVFSETPLQVAEILRFSLQETPEQIMRGMGQPVLVNDSDSLFRTWYFQTDVLDSHDHSHVLLFRKSDGRLLSVTRNYHVPIVVDALFPAGKSTIHHWPDAARPQLSVQVREYDADRVLIAMGVARPGQATSQVIVIRRSALRIFVPWLGDAEQGAVDSRLPR